MLSVMGSVERQRVALAVIAVLAIAVVVLLAMVLNQEDGTDDADEQVTALDVAEGGTPVEGADTGFVPDGCWPDDARSDDSGYAQWESEPEMVIDEDATYIAVMTTNKGEMTFELNTEAAPRTVNNFICLAANEFYDITPFHRVIAEFMVQGGDPTGTGTGGPGYRFEDELPGDDLNYVKGTLAMANAGPDTQGSQFFIVHGERGSDLPKNYTIFGQMTEGEDVLDDIADSMVIPGRSGEPSMPAEFLVIEDITIQESSGS